MNAIDPKLYRSVMGQFATGVTVVTYRHDGKPAGMTANAFMSVSLNPALVLISVRNPSRFSSTVRIGDQYGVSFLRESQEGLSSHFGGRPNAAVGSPFVERCGTPLIAGALAHIVAHVVDIHEAGDHLLYIGAVEHLQLGEQARPLIFFGGKYKQIHAHEPVFSWSSPDGW